MRKEGNKFDARKGVKPAFWGVLAEEVDPGASRQPDKDRVSRDATKTVRVLSLGVTRVLSSVLAATTRLYFQTGWSVRLKALSILSRYSKAPS